MNTWSDGDISEPAYAILEAGRVSPPAANRPFGPGVHLASRPDALAARRRIVDVMRELSFLLDMRLRQVAPDMAFRAVPLGGPTPRDADPASLFGPGRSAAILCEGGPASGVPGRLPAA